jgi:predicted DNA-binding transcriptional regulator
MLAYEQAPLESGTENREAILKGLEYLGLGLYDGSVLINFVKAGEGYVADVLRESEVPRCKRYCSIEHLLEIGALQLVHKLPLNYRAISPLKLYFGRIKKMCNELDTVTEGITSLQERKFEDEQLIIDALQMLGLSTNEAKFYETLVRYGDGSYSKVRYHSNIAEYTPKNSLPMRSEMIEKDLIEIIDKKWTGDTVYHAVFPNSVLFDGVKKLWQEVDASVKAVTELQAMYGTVPVPAENKELITDRLRQARIILAEKGGITTPNIKELTVKDWHDKEWPMETSQLEKLQVRWTRKHKKGDFV